MSKTKKILNIPTSALVVLVGPAGSGKTTFANGHFRATEVLSSDFFRGMVSDDEGDQDATGDAFALLHLALEKRLSRGRLCVVDATNAQAEHRAHLVKTANAFQRQAVAMVFETPLAICIERAGKRVGRIVKPEVICRQAKEVAPLLDEDLLGEGFAGVFRLAAGEQVEIRRTK